MTGFFSLAHPDHGAVSWDCPTDVWLERAWATMGFLLEDHSKHSSSVWPAHGALGPLALGAAGVSQGRVGGLLVPGGLQCDAWSRHFLDSAVSFLFP